ncbi:hypothetical protein [Mesorhizobium sp. B2-8-3]|uniref:hypothetical protein n=1 Tax=Mesorhizobium sp. B2-8-3 TaxID=2589905 RepID=UPI001126EC47|nr:hypothetical protein [Mesorhizobium sp. B2-8-3]TPJ33676.1 hypothetical protein FJ418_13685 [Mesorhizobium sp. B2-8-3]
MKVTVEDATMEHVFSVLDDIRLEDYAEWWAGTGEPFEEAVTRTFELGDPKRVALLDGIPLCFWGWHPDGTVWLFATDQAVNFALPIQRHLRPELARIQAELPVIKATADARNTVHHVWLRWCGFEEHGEVHLAPFGLPFKVFTRKASPCASAQS